MARLCSLQQCFVLSLGIVLICLISSGLSLWAGCCLNATSCEQTECRKTHVSVPLPFHCEAIPAHCYRGVNLLRPNRSIEAFHNGVPVIYNQSMVFCTSVMLTPSEFNHWRIEFTTIQNVYAVLLWRIGPLDEPDKLKVQIVRNVSSHLRESMDCKYSNQYDNYHHFNCYSHEKLTSDYRLGIEGHTIEIKGSFFIDNSRDLTKSVKVYSYPIRLCAPPEAYDNQQVYPDTSYYFAGQQVEYKCQGVALMVMVGNATRKCKKNGLWSGRTPICVRVGKIHPKSYSIKHYDDTGTETRNLYLPASSRFQALMLVPQYVLAMQLEKNYCLNKVSMIYYSEPSQRSNITVTVASNVTLAIDSNLHDESRVIHYRTGGNENFVCTKHIVVERHRDKVQSPFTSAELILDVYGIGYENPTYQCLRFTTFDSYNFFQSPPRFAKNGETFELRCSQGFEPDEDYSPKTATTVKCTKGAWEGLLPNCKRSFCLSPQTNAFSSWLYKNDSRNEKDFLEINYKCDDGFEIQGENLLRCINGKWDHKPPSCQVTYCSPIQTSKGRMVTVEGQRLELVNEKDGVVLYHHGVTLQFYCSPGFDLMGNRTIECANGKWSSSPPVCKEILCDFPPFKVKDLGPYYTLNDTWSIGYHLFSCPDGFTLERNSIRKKIASIELNCQPNGRWLEELEDIECLEEIRELQIVELASISTSIIIFIALVVLAIYIYMRVYRDEDRGRDKVVPLRAPEEPGRALKESGEDLIKSSGTVVTTKGEAQSYDDVTILS